jgi:Glycosyl transferases group 1
MQSLFILNPSQFGYHSDTYYYCKYLQNDFKITYLCWDYNHPKIDIENVNVVYISRTGKKIIRYWKFIQGAIKYIEKNKPDIVFIKYFRLSSLVKLLTSHKLQFVLDIRTAGVHSSYFKRLFYNSFIYLDQLFFNSITIISEGLIKKLALKKNKCTIIPLGAEIISNTEKNFTNLNLLYIGTLSNRKLEITVEGIAVFLKQNEVEIYYDLVGSGDSYSLRKIKLAIEKYGLKKIVRLHGRIPHNELKDYLDNSSIGVSFIPLTDYYQHQPPTKTYEYLLSGLAVIATDTFENRRIITTKNGILINDDAMSFARSLKQLKENSNKFNSFEIRNTNLQLTWENIILTKLKPYLENVAFNEKT